MQAALFGGAREEFGEREGALRRVFEQARRENRGAGIDEGRDLALGCARMRRPSAAKEKSPRPS